VADITRPSAATVGEYDHVAAAAYLMKHAGSAALVVLGAQPGNRPIGVITEADIARAVAGGMDVNTTRIHDLLTARPAAIPARERRHAAGRGGVAPVGERRRRQGAEEDVTDDPSAQAADHGQGHHPHDVHTGRTDRGD